MTLTLQDKLLVDLEVNRNSLTQLLNNEEPELSEWSMIWLQYFNLQDLIPLVAAEIKRLPYFSAERRALKRSLSQMKRKYKELAALIYG